MKKTLKTALDLFLLGLSAILLIVGCNGLIRHASMQFLQITGLLCLVTIILIGVIQLINSFHGPKGT